MTRWNAVLLAAPIAGLLLAAAPVRAQSVTAAFADFSGHSKEPVKIEADRLEVRETDQAAVFSGNVVVVQGKSTLRTTKLTIEYTEKAKAAAADGGHGASDAAAAPGTPPATPIAAQAKQGSASARLPTSSRDIRRLIADGNVIVTSEQQRATGSHGIFDMASNVVTLTGNVVLTQGGNVLRGERLTVDLTSQRSRLESPHTGGRVQGVFVPGSVNETQTQTPRRGGRRP